jgi:subtilisin-like proprotein convertase family protein
MSAVTATRVIRSLLVAALAAFGLVVVSAPTAGAATPACQRTFTSETKDVEIPDEGFVTSTIDVPEDGLVVADLDVTVTIHHPSPVDLEIALSSNDDVTGTRTEGGRLFNHEGDVVGANLLGTTLDDEAGAPIAWGDAPFTGRFIPTRPLAVYDGFTGGRYQLEVFDTLKDDTGTLNDWSVTLTYRSCDFDADGVEDHADQCRDLAARTATGCPVTNRAVTAKYKSGKFRGALSSPVAGCKAGRQVSVFQVRRGADARVGTATTRADGTYKLARVKKKGRYYATSPRSAVTGVAECSAVKSRTLRIR